MPICAQWRGPIPKNTKGIILHGLRTYDIFANHVFANISYVCKPCNPCWYACKHIIVHKTYHMFVSQLVNPPWHPCKSAPWQASNLQFPLQAHWHIGMMQWHLHVVPMSAREERCISILPSLFLGVGLGNFCWWVCLPDQHWVSLIYFPINFDSNASWSSPPPLGLYIYNLILGLLPVDTVINLHKSSECEVLSSCKDFADTAPTNSSAGAAVFMTFLALVFFALCLTAIMSLA